MKLDKTHLLIAGAALISLACAIGILAFLSSKSGEAPQKSAVTPVKKPATAVKISAPKSAPPDVIRPSLLGLRGALPSFVALPTTVAPSSTMIAHSPSGASVPALFAQTANAPSTTLPTPSSSPEDDSLVEGTISAISSKPSGDASTPPPLPPRRPIDLEVIAQANSVNAPDALPPTTDVSSSLTTAVGPPAQVIDAPIPPPRPRDLTGAEASATQSVLDSATQAASALTSGARPSEATLRPAQEESFQQPPPKLGMGDPVFVRIFKQEGQLELWLKKNGKYHLYKTFPICKWSGRLGPKEKEADYQSPEGFYSVSARQLNPHSNYHRAFNVGYPNAFDKQNGRTGGLVMVHGACKSVGCFAMTDRGIEEIYGFVEAALRAGQRDISVHIFPFRMTEANIVKETGGSWLAFVGGPNYSQWNNFWRNLKQGYDLFEQNAEPPVAFACGDHYEFGTSPAACKRVAGW
ncbi:MAG: hypothetical protein EBS82_06260 [Methylocystaceae bacterium]|nr:hypothetical protein [Methylocystaceae bacterium]NBT97316.1 hypothetical protein [Methylocystaceae bacterium]